MLMPLARCALIVALACLASANAHSANEKRVALVIGNAAYASITPLLKPANDAQRIAGVLREIGYTVIHGVNADRRELERLTGEFQAALANADVGFFFYSGHGFQTNRIDQPHPVNHIVPVDFAIGEPDQSLPTVALDTIIDALRSKARVGFVFMDACRNDPQLTAASERLARGTRTVSIARGFSPVSIAVDRPVIAKANPRKGPKGLLIAYATDPGNVALEGDKGSLSPFTSALVKHLATPGLSAAEMMGRVSAEVSAETDGLQTPWNVSSLTAGTYQFRPGLLQSPGQPSRASAPAPVRRASGGSAGSSGATAGRPPKSSGGGGGGPVSNKLPPNLGAGVGAGL